MSRESLLAGTLVELADTLVDEFDVIELLILLADRCVEVLDVQAAGIMLTGPDGQLYVAASSSDAMRFLEQFDVQTQEGPCFDAYRTGQAVVNQDLDAGSDRWPRFCAEALDAGFHSAHALPMHLGVSVIGALNLFRTGVGEMGPADFEVAQAFADVATMAIVQHRAAFEAEVLARQLRHTLDSRVVLEQAKGMLAEGLDLDMEQSFAVLRNHARNHNLRLGDVAESVIDGSLAVSGLDEPIRSPISQSASGPPLLLDVVPEGDTCVVSVSGELDRFTSDQLVSVATADHHPEMVIDLGGVTFLDCSGYGALVASRLAIESEHRSLAVTGQTGQPARLWKLIADLESGRSVSPEPGRDQLTTSDR